MCAVEMLKEISDSDYVKVRYISKWLQQRTIDLKKIEILQRSLLAESVWYPERLEVYANKHKPPVMNGK